MGDFIITRKFIKIKNVKDSMTPGRKEIHGIWFNFLISLYEKLAIQWYIEKKWNWQMFSKTLPIMNDQKRFFGVQLFDDSGLGIRLLAPHSTLAQNRLIVNNLHW